MAAPLASPPAVTSPTAPSPRQHVVSQTLAVLVGVWQTAVFHSYFVLLSSQKHPTHSCSTIFKTTSIWQYVSMKVVSKNFQERNRIASPKNIIILSLRTQIRRDLSNWLKRVMPGWVWSLGLCSCPTAPSSSCLSLVVAFCWGHLGFKYIFIIKWWWQQ